MVSICTKRCRITINGLVTCQADECIKAKVWPQGHSGSSLKNNILPGGAPETARDLKAGEPYERKDTDID